MKFSININSLEYPISRSIMATLKDIKFKVKNQKDNEVAMIDTSNLSFLSTVPTTSLSHFYVLIAEKKYRVKKELYNVLKKEQSRYLDKFYTKPIVAQSCISWILSTIEIKKHDLVVEPSAGDGAFVNALKKVICKKSFMDTMPENSEIERTNFLTWQPPKINGKIHIIGNPPFGRQSSICHQFIRHGATFADNICFILPISFKKQYNLSKIPTKFHLIMEKVLDLNSFTLEGNNFSVPTVFQIWEKRNIDRKGFITQIPQGFAFVKKPDACFSICRSGNAGFATTNYAERSNKHNYFIKLEDKSLLTRIIEKINNTHMIERNYNIGAPTVNKYEITKSLNHIISEIK